MSAELKSCPFCGARPYAHVQNTHGTVLNHPGRWRQGYRRLELPP